MEASIGQPIPGSGTAYLDVDGMAQLLDPPRIEGGGVERLPAGPEAAVGTAAEAHGPVPAKPLDTVEEVAVLHDPLLMGKQRRQLRILKQLTGDPAEDPLT